MSVKLLTKHHLEFLDLKGSCMPHCWKSVMASFQMFSLTLCMLGNLSCICCCQRFSFFKINLFVCSIALLPVDIITCVTLAKAGLVIGQLPPSIHPSVCPSASLLGCLVCVICYSKSFHSFIFKLCKMAY